MTRIGKIARLPREVREQLNRRSQDGQPESEVLAWLNALPEVRSGPAPESAGCRVNEQDLSAWKESGYPDWLAQQEVLELARQLSAEVAELKQSGEEPLADNLARWLTAQYVVAAKTAVRRANGGGLDLKSLRALCGDVVALRRGDHYAECLRIERERLAHSKRALALKHKKDKPKAEAGADPWYDEVKDNPKVEAALLALAEVLKEAHSDLLRPNPAESAP